jgi:hypothetical protein
VPNFKNPPGDIRWKKWFSYPLPYVGVVALLFVAVYVLFKAVTGYIDPYGSEYSESGIILRNVAAMAVLVFGVTVTTRIPRLTRIWYRAIGCLDLIFPLRGWVLMASSSRKFGMAPE